MDIYSYSWLTGLREALERQLAAGRVPQALLIHGPQGTGRRHLAAWVLARCLGMDDSPTDLLVPGALRHPDLLAVTPEETRKGITVHQVRELTAFLGLTSHQGGRKAAVIWPAEAMNINAANALLKTLEEPPGPSTLVLVATTPSRLPPTVVSRCQSLRVPVPTPGQALAWLRQVPAFKGDWERLLETAGGGPLLARELAEAGAGDVLERLMEDLEHLMAAGDSPVAVARRWAREDPELCLNTLYLTLRQRLRRAIGAESGLQNRPGMPNSPLQIGQRTVTMAAGFAYLDRLVQARRQLDRSLNAELQLADLLMWWFGATAGAGAARSPR